MEIAPGSILQRMYLKERIKTFGPKTFCEIGSGNGYVSKILLEKNLTGKAFDLNAEACENCKVLNKEFIDRNLFSVHNKDFLSEEFTEKFDLIISSMVIEHLDEDAVARYFVKCKTLLSEKGRLILLVPSSMKYWSIEDDIAGHFKRYDFEDFRKLAIIHQMEICKLAGLTFPLSNWLFGLSNKLVSRNESYKKELSRQEQTVLSGNRKVPFKTSYPFFMQLILNEMVLFPFHILQKLNSQNKNSMILYCELKKPGP